MRRLYQKLYLVFLASLLSVLAIGLFWRMGPGNSAHGQFVELAGEFAAAALPPADAPSQAQQRAIERLSTRLHADIALFDSSLAPIAAAGRPLPQVTSRSENGGWMLGSGGAAWSVRLPDQRWIVLRTVIGRLNPLYGLTFFLGFMALAIAIFAYPVVRGLTKRIERLQSGVETLGAGNLATRVAVEGRDEVAQLAASFNHAAARIEELVGAHRLLLANASHELRTPLSRIRLGIELYETSRDPKIKADLGHDIAELDDLIEEILLASRLDIAAAPSASEEIDFLALVAEECARYDVCTLDGDGISVTGDQRLLRRAVRNLLDNAQRHGRPPVRAELRRDGANAALSIIDSGDGIPPAEHDQIFMPFYRLGADRQGSGLGLALVRQIARLHGGDVLAATRPDCRSCFVIQIPVHQILAENSASRRRNSRLP